MKLQALFTLGIIFVFGYVAGAQWPGAWATINRHLQQG